MTNIETNTICNPKSITKYNPEKTLKIKGVKRICHDFSKICHDLSNASTKDSFSSPKAKNFRINSSTKTPNQEHSNLVKSAVSSIFKTKSNPSSPISNRSIFSRKGEIKATRIPDPVIRPLKAISFSILKNKTIEISKKRDTPKKLVIRSDEKKNLRTSTTLKAPDSPLSNLKTFDSDTESEISLEENDFSLLSEDVHESTELSFITQISDDFCSSLNTSQILRF